MLLGVDVGGTFTDAVLARAGEIHTAKVPTTPGRESDGVMGAVRAVLDRAGAKPSDVTRFVHGLPVGTTALLEERGARVALVTTAGFEDVLEVARQDRPKLYDLCAPKPAPLVAENDRVGVAARMGPEGEVEPLAEAEAGRVADAVASLDPEAVAVCLHFSFRDATHENRIADAIRSRVPDLHTSVSSEVLPRFREFERTSTTVIDAYLTPLLGRYLGTLAEAAHLEGVPAPDVMRSSGGIAPWDEAARQGAWSVLSGPAGGAAGAGLVARVSAGGSAVGLDMGGTSCDVCVVDEGSVRIANTREIAGRPIQLPMVDVHTVGAGGGSIAWIDDGGALRVGPRSAGASPGPACYGNGGTEPTVTDANLVLGRLAPDTRLAGDLQLDAEAAEVAVGGLGERMGLDVAGAALGILRLANAEMARAVRVVTVNRGIDPRSYALMPFGGAGGLHAADLCTEIGMGGVVAPRAAGVLSALGMVASPRRRDTAQTVMLAGDAFERSQIDTAIARMRAAIGDGMEGATEFVTFELRYRGQSFELDVEAPASIEPADLAERFAEAHRERYGFRVDGAEVELVAIRLALELAAEEPRLAASGTADLHESEREVHFADGPVPTRILRGEPGEGYEAVGPAIFELADSTLVVPPGWRASVDAAGSILAETPG